MSLGLQDGIGNSTWSQVGDNGIEIRIPAALPDGVRPKDLTVSIKDSSILQIAANSTTLLQWRLFAPVLDESTEEAVEWVYEDEHLVVDLKKKVPGGDWKCLLDLPLKKDDPLLMTKESLDELVGTYLPTQRFKTNAAQEETNNALDEVLESSLEEIKAKKPEEETTMETFMKREHEMLEKTMESLKNRLTAAETLVKQAENNQEEIEVCTPEKLKEERDMIPILKTKIEYQEKIMELRSQRMTVDSFVEAIHLGIKQLLIGGGEEGEDLLDEPFANEEEKNLTPLELFTLALSGGDLDEPARLHFLRLAAIQHKHVDSISVLFARFPHHPIGPYLLLERALDDKDLSAEANHMVGDLFSTSSRFFVPMLPVAVYFYQRAAQLGYVASMLSLGLAWSRGYTEDSLLADEVAETLKNTSWFHAWLQKAVDRGSGAALFVMGCLYISGEHGTTPSSKRAKQLLDAAEKTGGEASNLVRNSNLAIKLDELRAKEAEEEKKSIGEAAAGTQAEPAKQQVAPMDDEPAPPRIPPVNEQPKAFEASSKEEAPVSHSNARLSVLSSSSPIVKPEDSSATGQREGIQRTKNMEKSRSDAVRRLSSHFWVKVGKGCLVAYSAFVLAFPLRVMVLPTFYEILSTVAERIPWLMNKDYSGLF